MASVLAEGRSQAPLRAAVWSISGDYFRCLGIRRLRGDITDLQRIQEAVVIDAAGAQAIFGRDEALGQRVSWGTPRRYGIVVAVVGDIHDMRVNVATNSKSSFAGAHLYIDASDEPPLVVRVAARAVDTRAGLKALDEAIKGVDRDMPLSGLESLEQLVDVQLARERFLFVVAMVIGIVSVGVALAGMFALMTHAATERSHEIGVRLAIGARPSGILIMILQEALGMTSLTLIASVPLLLLSSSALAAVLFETSSLDLTVFGSVVGIILAVTIAASLMPAMRAASINVNEMLRRL